MSTPEVSICLTTFNRADKLRVTIDSILSQSFQNFELIISDNCSTDDTEAICLEYCNSDSRVIFNRNPSNLGMPGNLNAAINLARGHYIANIHDGDVYKSNLISDWKFALDKYPSAGFVFNAYSERMQNGEWRIYKESYDELIPGRELGKRLLSRWDSCVHGTVMARRNIYTELDGFDPAYGYLSDVDMWLRIALKHDVAYINSALIELMPKDLSRFYGFIDWQVTFWLLAIHAVNLRRYRNSLPDFVLRKSRTFKRDMRLLIMRQILICIKYKRFDLLKQIFCMSKDSGDGILALLGFFSYDSKSKPAWYKPEHWSNLILSDMGR